MRRFTEQQSASGVWAFRAVVHLISPAARKYSEVSHRGESGACWISTWCCTLVSSIDKFNRLEMHDLVMEIGLFTHSNMCHSVRQHCRGTYGCCTDSDRNLSVHNYWLLDLHLLLPTFKVEPCAARSMSQICRYQQKCWCAGQFNDFHEFKFLFFQTAAGSPEKQWRTVESKQPQLTDHG